MKKKVLIIGPGMEIGGVERSLLGLLDAINYDQYEVDLFLLSHTGEFMPLINQRANLLPEYPELAQISRPIGTLFKEANFRVGLTRLASKLYGDIRARIRHTDTVSITLCKKLIMRNMPTFQKQYDFALSFFAPHYLLSTKVNARVKVGWVHTDYTNANERPDESFMMPMWASLDYIACVSEAVEQSFVDVYPSLSSKTFIAENILSPTLIYKQAQVFDAGVEMPKDERVRILSVGRFSTAKNFDSIPEACRRLLDMGYQIKWFLIGYGPDEPLIISKIKEFGVEGTVVILGKRDNPYPFMKACDIYAQPSRYEGKAVSVREAQILHKPVMITRFSTSASQLEEGFDGYVCDLGVDGIVDGIKYMIDHPAFCDMLSKNTYGRDYSNRAEIDRIFSLGEDQCRK